jgi:hypothetical protein
VTETQLKHCWHPSTFQHSMPNHSDEVCCHCGANACVSIETERDPAHGEHAELGVQRRVGVSRRIRVHPGVQPCEGEW